MRRPLFQGNFGVVDPAKVYRSAQPDRNLESTIQTNRLGSIVNLRGGTEADAFYRHEVATTERLRVEFYDLPLGATRRPSRRELMLAIAVLKHCRYPLLIHCKWGSDRTGLMSALYQLVILGEPPETAMRQFTAAHGHVPLFGPEHLHEPIDEYAAWLVKSNLKHNPSRFLNWLERVYRSEDAFGTWPTVRAGARSVVHSQSTIQN